MHKLILVFSLLLISPSQASAACGVCDAIQHSTVIAETSERTLSGIRDMWNYTIKPYLEKMSNQMSAEIEKLAVSQAKTAEAIATYQMQADLNREAIKIKRDLEPAQNTCKIMDNAQRIANATAASRTKTAMDSKKMSMESMGSTSETQQAANLAAKSRRDYMTAEDKARYNLPGQPGEFAGGDFDTNILFGNRNGGLTYAPNQEAVVDDMIRRKTMGGPENLRDPEKETSARGMLYREMQRKYAAFSSNMKSAYLFVKSFHTSISGEKSVMELMEDQIKTHTSPEAVIARNDKSQAALLKEIAAMDAARLNMDYHNLKFQERMLILIADQQAMLTEEIIGTRAAAMKPE